MERYGGDLEGIAQTLEASDQYRVLRRLMPRSVINQPDCKPTRIGLFVDVETTGLDSSCDDVIELAMVPFTFGMNGTIYEVGRPFQQLSEPAKAVPADVQQLTGLSAAALNGQKLDLFEVARYVSPVDLIVAHHANFDRPFLERISPVFRQKPWACSMSQIEWRALGYESTKLDYLGMKTGFFFDGHRAVWDCFAGIELLAGRAGESTGMQRLLKNALTTTWRIGVTGSPFEANQILRERGYQWARRGASEKRRWEIQVGDAGKPAELAVLKSERFKAAKVTVEKVTPFDRFSDR